MSVSEPSRGAGTPAASGAQSPLPRVYVVCSLYHPGAVLDRQIETILGQDHRDLRLLLRSDDADASTARRIAEWARRDDRIDVLGGVDERIGTLSSYGQLIEAALARGAPWIALADQDDEWQPHHLSRSLELAAHHARGDLDLPLLVHGDLELIDEAGRTLAPSFFAHARIRHESREPLRVLVVQNFVTGCASVFNRSLAELAMPMADAAIMHDWWLALCAASTGRLLQREASTVRYRQHASNQLGARAYGDVLRDLGRRTFSLQRHSNEPLRDTVMQAHALRQRLGVRASKLASPEAAALADRAAQFLDRYLALFKPGRSRLRRSCGILQLGVRRQAFLLDLSLKSKLLTTSIAVDDPKPEA